MKGFQVLSASQQVAGKLREELIHGTWVGLMPGEDRLMARLSVGRNTIKEALKILESEGILENRGAGRQRKISLPSDLPRPSLRVGLLLYEPGDWGQPLINFMRQYLLEAGHTPVLAETTLLTLKMDPKKIARFVKKHEFDAWIVHAATKEVLEWFIEYDVPSFSVYGSMLDLTIAGATTDKLEKVVDLFQSLIDLGHRRIVLLTRSERIIPKLGRLEQCFIDKLESCGIPTSEYNLPIWNSEPDGLRNCLDKLFQHTPPTAIYTSEFHLFNTIQNYLAAKGIHAPEDISLVCGESSFCFRWQKPLPTHFQWDSVRVAQKATQWVNQVARGHDHKKKAMVKAKLVEGGTMGPPP